MKKSRQKKTDVSHARLVKKARGAGLVAHDGWYLHPEVLVDYDLFRTHAPPRPVPLMRQLRSELLSWSGLVWIGSAALLGWGLYHGDVFALAFGAAGGLAMAYLLQGVWRTQRYGRMLVGRAVSRVTPASSDTGSYAKYQVLLPEGEAWWSLELALPSRPADYLLECDEEFEVVFMVHRSPRSAYPFGLRRSEARDRS